MKILEKIENHLLRQNESQSPQLNPSIQLTVALFQLGSNGNQESIPITESFLKFNFKITLIYHEPYHIYHRILECRLFLAKKDRMGGFISGKGYEIFPCCVGFDDLTTTPLIQKAKLNQN